MLGTVGGSAMDNQINGLQTMRSEERTRVSLSQDRIALSAVAVCVAVAIEAELSMAVRWQAGGYSIQVAATRPRALKYSRLPYQTKTRNWISDAHSLTTEQTTRRSRAIVLALQT